MRVIVGTGALVALAAVLALALGTALRRGAGAVTAAIVLIVVPYILAFASALPAGVVAMADADHARRRVRRRADAPAIPPGLLPLHARPTASTRWRPAAGLAVLGAYALVALLVAHRLLRRRDA